MSATYLQPPLPQSCAQATPDSSRTQAEKRQPSFRTNVRNLSYAAVSAGSARRRRLTTRSRPRTTIVSKSGGATAWPTMATRVALMSRPALTPSASARARNAWSQASWLQSAGGIAASASASLASSSGTLGSFQNLALAAASISNSSEKNARDQVEKSGSRRMRGRNKSTVLENHSRPAPLAHSSFHRPLRFSSAPTSGSKSSMGSFCRYCVLNHSSLARSKTALVRLTPSSENFSSKSLVSRNSSSPPALQPSSARKLRKASGRKPSARYMLTSVAPWRLESRDLSGPRISGTCAKTGGSAPSARYSSTCLGVLEMWSAPRITWVMRMSMSSTTTPSWYMDWPNSSSPLPERSRTKSSISSLENSRSPKTASKNLVVPPVGTRKRTAGFVPGVEGWPSRQVQRTTRRGPAGLGSSSCASTAWSPPA